MPYKGALVVLTSFYNELPMMKGRPSNENRSSVGYLERAASTIMNFGDKNALSMAIASRRIRSCLFTIPLLGTNM